MIGFLGDHHGQDRKEDKVSGPFFKDAQHFGPTGRRLPRGPPGFLISDTLPRFHPTTRYKFGERGSWNKNILLHGCTFRLTYLGTCSHSHTLTWKFPPHFF